MPDLGEISAGFLAEVLGFLEEFCDGCLFEWLHVFFEHGLKGDEEGLEEGFDARVEEVGGFVVALYDDLEANHLAYLQYMYSKHSTVNTVPYAQYRE